MAAKVRREGFRKKVSLNLKGLREALIFDLHLILLSAQP